MKKTLKEKVWNKKIKDLQDVTDRLGNPIDAHILEIVVALNLLGISTSQSCEGHLKEGKTSYPWINISPENEEKSYQDLLESIELRERADKLFVGTELSEEARVLYKRARLLKNQSQESMLREFYKVWTLLKEYYTNKSLNIDTQLVLVDISPIQGCIKSQGSIFQDLYTLEDKEKKLAEYQHEMLLFGDFLKQKFFNS